MPSPEFISSRSNPLIKSTRLLKDGRERKKAGKFLVEGILPIGEASAAGWRIDMILFAPDLLESDYARNLISGETAKGVRCIPVSAPVLESLAEKENPQGLVAVVSQKTALLEDLKSGDIKFAAALIAPQDPGNVGTILRTLDAAGGDGMFLLDGGVDLFHPSVVRASMGAVFWTPVVKTTFVNFLEWARKHGFRLIGTSAHADLDYRELKTGKAPSILVLGNEQKGLDSDQLAACDTTIRIPMRGRAGSLNLAVAAGVLLFSLIEKFPPQGQG
jgi:TrmH family RNA methyltransferase